MEVLEINAVHESLYISENDEWIKILIDEHFSDCLNFINVSEDQAIWIRDWLIQKFPLVKPIASPDPASAECFENKTP